MIQTTLTVLYHNPYLNLCEMVYIGNLQVAHKIQMKGYVSIFLLKSIFLIDSESNLCL